MAIVRKTSKLPCGDILIAQRKESDTGWDIFIASKKAPQQEEYLSTYAPWVKGNKEAIKDFFDSLDLSDLSD